MIDILSQTGIPVIPVNMEGVMGAGLAKEAKERLLVLEPQYRHELNLGSLDLGMPCYLPPAQHWPKHNKGVILFVTKWSWREPSQYPWIDKGMQRLAQMAREVPDVMNNHVWIPALGCGLGGLDERRVYEMYLLYLAHLPRMHFIGKDGYERSPGDTLFRDNLRKQKGL